MVALVALLAAVAAACGGSEGSVTTTTATATTATTAASTTTAGQPGGDGAALLNARCTECHNLGRVTSVRQTQEWWAGTVDRMVAKGTQLSEAEKAVLVAYLAETYGP